MGDLGLGKRPAIPQGSSREEVIRMRVHLFPQGDGLVTVYVKRTLAKEGPSRAARYVSQEDVPEVTARLCAEMRREQTQRDA